MPVPGPTPVPRRGPPPPLVRDLARELAGAIEGEALRSGTPNRNRIALQMVKDMLDESSFEASPAGIIPDKVGQALSGIAGRLRNRADEKHPE